MNASLFAFAGNQPSASRDQRGFTLVEMLTVMAIIAILSVASVPLISSLMKANEMDTSATTLSGILEQARETALSANTFVWVALTDAPENSPVGTWVATIQSKDGTSDDVTSGTSWQQNLAFPTTNTQLLDRVRQLPGVRLVSPTSLSSTLTAKAPTAQDSTYLLGQNAFNANWTITNLPNVGSISGSTAFTHVIEFTPSGEAEVPGADWYNNIQFGLVPTIGSTQNAILYDVVHLTGKTSAYRQ